MAAASEAGYKPELTEPNSHTYTDLISERDLSPGRKLYSVNVDGERIHFVGSGDLNKVSGTIVENVQINPGSPDVTYDETEKKISLNRTENTAKIS